MDFCRTGCWVHPCHRTFFTCVVANVFRPFVVVFTSELGRNCFRGTIPKRGSPGTEQLFPNREPVCPKASGWPADPPVRDRIVDIPQCIRALRLPRSALQGNLPRKEAPQKVSVR